MNDKNNEASAIMPLINAILIIMLYISQQNGSAQRQDNNDKFSPLSSTITTNNITNTLTKKTNSTTNSVSVFYQKDM